MWEEENNLADFTMARIEVGVLEQYALFLMLRKVEEKREPITMTRMMIRPWRGNDSKSNLQTERPAEKESLAEGGGMDLRGKIYSPRALQIVPLARIMSWEK